VGTPAADPDFQEVQGTDQAGRRGGRRVHARRRRGRTCADPIPLKTDEAPAGSNVEPIGKGRRGGAKRSAGGANLE
jgi:hypothetical protein